MKTLIERILSATLILCIILFLNSNNKFIHYPTCFNDKTFSSTENLYFYLSQHKQLKNLIQILTSAYFDIILLIVSYYWIIYGSNWRPIVSISLFFTLRELCNFAYEIKPHEDLDWEYPGIPSLIFPYYNNTGYFFSASVGFGLILCLELKSLKKYTLSVMTLICLIVKILFFASLRAQYFISVFCGLIVAHYCHIISNKFCEFMDDLYDFNLEENEKEKSIKREQQIKEIIELSIKNNKSKVSYVSLEEDSQIKYDEVKIM